MVQVSYTVLLGRCHRLHPDEIRSLKKVKLTSSRKRPQLQPVKGNHRMTSVPGHCHVLRIPPLIRLFHPFFPAEGIIGIGIPLIIRLLVSSNGLNSLRVVGRPPAGDHLKLGPQHP